MCHAGLDTVRISPVPMIVESPDHHVVVANKRLFIGEHRIVALFEIACLIQMAVESGLVSDGYVEKYPRVFWSLLGTVSLAVNHHEITAGTRALSSLRSLARCGHPRR